MERNLTTEVGGIAKGAAIRDLRLRWMSKERASRRRKRLGYTVTIYNPRGLYPRGTVMVPGGVFSADEKVVFSVVWGGTWERLDPDLPYSELQGLSPDCLRLVASIMLCERRDGARCRFYPEAQSTPKIDKKRLRLDREDVIREIRIFLIDQLQLCTGGSCARFQIWH
ncbi:MAG TPA: hypothetical protein VGN46_02830 [Luteibacter sp.]|uniref:hypothetical protein n=1 Tax=Luteibacter sp. TaxID=1886636 RepID=UPI002F3E7A34